MDLFDLVVFFESEATVGARDVAWEYSGASFEFRRGNDVVWCRVAPGEGDITLRWEQDGVRRVEVSLSGYFDLKLETLSGRERLVAIRDEFGWPPFVLELKPNVFIALGAFWQ